jgi:hypothetical protein
MALHMKGCSAKTAIADAVADDATIGSKYDMRGSSSYPQSTTAYEEGDNKKQKVNSKEFKYLFSDKGDKLMSA